MIIYILVNACIIRMNILEYNHPLDKKHQITLQYKQLEIIHIVIIESIILEVVQNISFN